MFNPNVCAMTGMATIEDLDDIFPVALVLFSSLTTF